MQLITNFRLDADGKYMWSLSDNGKFAHFQTNTQKKGLYQCLENQIKELRSVDEFELPDSPMEAVKLLRRSTKGWK
ncbi:MAG: hypothetical protein ACI86H_002520 [bacterium]|jgi:hypothetical protein